MHNFNNIKLYSLGIIGAKFDAMAARNKFLATAKEEYARDPLGAALALQKIVCAAYKVKLQPADKRAPTGYTVPVTNGAGQQYSRLLGDISGKKEANKRGDAVKRLVAQLEKLDSLTLIALERQLPALIRAKQKAEAAK